MCTEIAELNVEKISGLSSSIYSDESVVYCIVKQIFRKKDFFCGGKHCEKTVHFTVNILFYEISFHFLL